MNRWLVPLTAVAVLAGCGIKKDVYRQDMDRLRGQIARIEKDKGTLLKEKERLTNELSLVGKEKGALSKDLKSALDRVDELKRQADKRKAALDALKGKLQSMVAAGKLRIRTDRGRMIVEMAEKVLFDVGRYRLTQDGKDALEQLTPILVSLEGRSFQVAGHTDDTGSDITNWNLSVNRAREVALQMIDMGMPPHRISIAGYGKFAPVASNDTPEGRAQNRRIEIVLVPNIEELMGFGD
ncbi:MAG: OmpA family protein [Deltaproteobacteria bacterium]|nr:OmpA family protein [Deltaproteobacteria bacterium]